MTYSSTQACQPFRPYRQTRSIELDEQPLTEGTGASSSSSSSSSASSSSWADADVEAVEPDTEAIGARPLSEPVGGERRAALEAPALDPAAQLASRLHQQFDARREGGLTGAELAEVRADAGAQAGAAEAGDAAMKELLSKSLGDLTADGLDWVQSDFGRMDGNLDGYQNVLGSLEEGSELIDANWNGKLDEGDVSVKPGSGEAGPGTVKQLDEAIRDRVTLNKNIVDAAYDMADAKHDFAGLDTQTFNEAFWEKDPSGTMGTFKLKEGVSAEDAMGDVFKNPDKYKFECATAMALTFYQGALKTMGSEKFNEMAKDLRVGPWEMEDDMTAAHQRRGDSTDAPAGFGESVTPGDWSYVKNRDVSPEGLEAGWQGENVIALGHGKFYGHPFGITNEAEVVDHLNKHRNEGSQVSAGFLNIVGEISTSLV